MRTPAAVLIAATLAGCGEAATSADREAATPTPTVAPCRPAGELQECRSGELRYLLADHGPGPVTVVLHGVGPGGTPEATAEETRLHEGADGIVVYPDWAGKDAAYLARLIEHVRRQETFVVGWSGGGFMAHELGCTVAGITAIAVLHAPLRGECAPEDPPRVLQIAGTGDEIIPFAGGRTPDGLDSPPVRRAVARWKRLGADVELRVVEGGGHEWYPDATDTIRRFFAT